MSKKPTIEQLREFFSKDTFAKNIGITIEEVKDGSCLCKLEVNEQHFNAARVVQGGAIFTLADFAFAVAANASGKLTLSLSSSISFMNGAACKTLYARATRLSSSRTVCFYDISVFDENDTPIANVTITGFIKNVDLVF